MDDYSVPVSVSCAMLTTTDIYRPPASTSLDELAPTRVIDPQCRVEIPARDSGELTVVVDQGFSSEVSPVPMQNSPDQLVLL